MPWDPKTGGYISDVRKVFNLRLREDELAKVKKAAAAAEAQRKANYDAYHALPWQSPKREKLPSPEWRKVTVSDWARDVLLTAAEDSTSEPEISGKRKTKVRPTAKRKTARRRRAA